VRVASLSYNRELPALLGAGSYEKQEKRQR
jgi:hypothetical protein